jgi:hypothetical protein
MTSRNKQKPCASARFLDAFRAKDDIDPGTPPMSQWRLAWLMPQPNKLHWDDAEDREFVFPPDVRMK